MRKLRQQIHRVADLDVPVLLRGATGVGKELVASAIHKNSRRASSTYVAVNVAGVPPSMAASELFGHRRGAFTGAFEDRKGYFAQADGGTLFLDEIGDVSFDVQALLLRAVQEGVIQPLGGSTRQVDVRLIAATDSDLESAVARREFREPLLRRFSYEIHVPPLRARRDDIGILFYHLLRERLEGMGEGHRLAAGPGDAESYVPASFVADLALHEWSGNVRELANVALKFAIENRGLARARVGDELRELVRTRRPPTAVESPVTAVSTSSPQKRPEPSDDDILDALRTEEFRRERAARRLGVSKSYLYKRIDTKPLVPIAAQISKAEIDAALSLCQGDLNAAARQLRVSARALRLQLNRLAHVSRDA
jgi:two-component system nitrogen regulation response regulator GlnG